jgi:hypothetical protein
MQIHRFTFQDQLAFAKLSGDYNPIHVDPVFARRSLFGKLVLHGVHSVLWALNQWFENHQTPMALKSIHAKFVKPIFLDEDVTYVETLSQSNLTCIDLICSNEVSTRIEIEWHPVSSEIAVSITNAFLDENKPLDLPRSHIGTDQGSIKLYLPRQAAIDQFPNLMQYLPLTQIAALLSSTYIVGMRCPGLHSLYSELALATTPISTGSAGMNSEMRYRVTQFDERFNLITISTEAPGLTGQLKAFVRPVPQAQPTFAEISSHVVNGEFKDQNALVIGGSRGLGEVVAKILAAGGAEVFITYSQGRQDAQKVVDEIVEAGQSANLFQLDISNSCINFADHFKANQKITHLYYFATPYIGAAIKGSFSPALFEKFCAFYITGFTEIVNRLKPWGLQKVFYPSTVYIDELPANMGEYVASKIAGESLCQFLNKTQLDITVWAPRLPRMSTDQTNSLIPLKSKDPLAVMLDHLRKFQELQK